LQDNPQSVHATAAQQPRNIPQATPETPAVSFQSSHSKIMNTPTTPQPTPDLESLRKAIQEFRPNPHRVPFNNLKPFHDSIVELRAKRASYRSVAELLQQHGVKTSRARVAEYGRIILDGGKSRKRRKRAKIAPATNTPVTPASVSAAQRAIQWDGDSRGVSKWLALARQQCWQQVVNTRGSIRSNEVRNAVSNIGSTSIGSGWVLREAFRKMSCQSFHLPACGTPRNHRRDLSEP